MATRKKATTRSTAKKSTAVEQLAQPPGEFDVAIFTNPGVGGIQTDAGGRPKTDKGGRPLTKD